MARKVAPKKAAERRTTPAEKTAAPRAATKAEIYTKLSERSGLSKKEVASVFNAMGDLIGQELGNKGPGLFVVPGLLKLKVVRRPATQEKQGVNPFTKEPMTIKAKPARNVVKAVPMKALKSLV